MLFATIEESDVEVVAAANVEAAPETAAVVEIPAVGEVEVAAAAKAEAVPETATTAAVVEVPAEVEAMDGINSEDEAHNAERPARKSLKKKAKGLPLSDFKVGDSIKGKVKTVTAYGAFVDIGAETDGLLHISNLSVDFVSSVKDLIEAGKEYDVRILSIDEGKKQIALTLLTAAQEEEAAANSSARPAKRESRGGSTGGPQSSSSNNNRSSSGGGGGGSNRRDDGPILKELQEKGWDDAKFVTGTVVSTVDFGAFVRVDCSQLNEETKGEFDGLVHISALSTGRVNSVEAVVKVGQVVQVRVKGIDQRKVSLTMVSVEDEAAQAESRGSGGGGSFGADQGFQGNKDWKEAMDKLQVDQPSFSNKGLIVDNRKQ